MQSETHPSSHNQGPTRASSGSKEGLSLYGLFQHFARTPQGRFLLRQQFLRPTLNAMVLSERLGAISVFVRPDNDGPIRELSQSLSQVKNMRIVMINLRKGVSTGTGTGRGVARGMWATLRQESFGQSLGTCQSTNRNLVCFSCSQDKRRSSRRCRL